MDKLQRRAARNALRDVLRKDGPEAALKHGIALGLSERRAQTYVTRYSRPRGRRKANPPDARRVYDIGCPSKHGTIVRAGDEVSEVQWDHRPTCFVNNEYLRSVENADT